MTVLTLDLDDLARDSDEIRKKVGPHAQVIIVDEGSGVSAAEAIGQIVRGHAREGLAALTALFRSDATEADIQADVGPLVRQAEINADARTRLLVDFKAYRSDQLASRLVARIDAAAASDPAAVWEAEGRVVSVAFSGTRWFPAFQFGDGGEPLPVLRPVLAALSTRLKGEWQKALWFTTPSAWLDGRRPVDLLVSDPESVIAAAERQFAGELRF